MKQNQIVAVTGASRGIGSAIAEELARRGFTVGCLSRKGVGPEDRTLAADLDQRLIKIACDVTDEEQCKAALRQLAGADGVLYGLVNNAGVYLEKPSIDLTTAEFNQVLHTNTSALFALCREAYPYLIAGGGGTIINLGSYFEKLGVRYTVAYNASKAAVGAITRCLAVEWARKGIRVLDVAPGVIITDINRDHLETPGFKNLVQTRIPLGQPGTPEQVGRLIGALLSEDLPFLTGETIHIDGGQGMAY